MYSYYNSNSNSDLKTNVIENINQGSFVITSFTSKEGISVLRMATSLDQAFIAFIVDIVKTIIADSVFSDFLNNLKGN